MQNNQLKAICEAATLRSQNVNLKKLLLSLGKMRTGFNEKLIKVVLYDQAVYREIN